MSINQEYPRIIRVMYVIKCNVTSANVTLKYANEMKIVSDHRQYILCILEPIAADFADNELKKPVSLNGLNLVIATMC